MAYALNGTTIERLDAKELHSTVIFDKVGSENTKPESVNSGSTNNHRDSPHESDMNGNSYTPILSDVPNFYKNYGTSVENSGYFIIPRVVTSDPRYQGARLKYQKVLLALFENAAFSPTTHAIGTEIIQIQIGQFCVSERRLVEICNEGVKFKEDLVDKNIVHRAVHFWSKCQIVRQEVIHDKTLLTITVPEFYERTKKRSEPGSEPKVNQNRTTKEEDKEDKEDNISREKGSFEPSPFATSLLSDFYSSLFSAIPDFPKDSAKKTKTQYQAAESIGRKAKYDTELIKKVIAYAHQPGGFWLAHVHSVSYLNAKFATLVQQLRTQGQKPMNGKAPSLHNKSFTKDTSPKKYNNTYDFSKMESPK